MTAQRTVYTCLLWHRGTRRPVLATVFDETEDRWRARRCPLEMTSSAAPLEEFLKSEWDREEKPSPAPERSPRRRAAPGR